jgi:hypothetical protein
MSGFTSSIATRPMLSPIRCMSNIPVGCATTSPYARQGAAPRGPTVLFLRGSMPKRLSRAEIERYWDQGCVFPIRVMSEADAAQHRALLEEFERRTGGPPKGDLRRKSHLLFAWLAKLVRHSGILDAVEDLHGSDLLCWTTNFFIKEAANPAFVSWHQDSTYWGLSRPDVVTAWSPSRKPWRRTKRWSTSPAATSSIKFPTATPSPKTICLRADRRLWSKVDPSQRRIITLRPGEMSLHHVRLVHGSPPNPSNDRRIGSRSATPQRAWPKSQARTAPPSCGARTATVILPRRLAAILAADVAGYSRLIGMDEGGTLQALQGDTSGAVRSDNRRA